MVEGDAVRWISSGLAEAIQVDHIGRGARLAVIGSGWRLVVVDLIA
jgi:hypothetical protein